MFADKMTEAWEEICEAIDHVARANWPGRDIEARAMAHNALQKAMAAVRADEREQAVARFKKLPSDWGQMAEDAIVEAIRNA